MREESEKVRRKLLKKKLRKKKESERKRKEKKRVRGKKEGMRWFRAMSIPTVRKSYLYVLIVEIVF